jgi:CRISPR-associated protein Csd2
MSTDNIVNNPELRHDFIILFDVEDGNPNGDPDAGNMPRLDPETMQGLVTVVCIKRKIRDYTLLKGQDIYVKHRGILANEQRKAYQAINADPQDSANDDARSWMCRRFYDIRMFGAVMTTGKAPADENSEKKGSTKKWNCGQVRGPVQLTFARSIHAVTPIDVSITRVALTNAGDTRKEDADEEVAGSGQMGRKSLLPYGLYMAKGFFSPAFAKDTGVTSEDMQLLWEALVNMWDLDHSAARGFMSIRGLYVFSHHNPLGNAPAHTLFNRINATLREEMKGTDKVARSFDDYEIIVDDEDLPDGVTLTRLVG